MNKALILANIDAALVALRATDDRLVDRLVDLSMYKQEAKCGTLYCLAGLLTGQPHFQAQGWAWDRDQISPWPQINGQHLCDASDDQFGPADDQFGPAAFANLFAARGEGLRDEAIFEEQRGYITDKDLAECRLRKQRRHMETLP